MNVSLRFAVICGDCHPIGGYGCGCSMKSTHLAFILYQYDSSRRVRLSVKRDLTAMLFESIT